MSFINNSPIILFCTGLIGTVQAVAQTAGSMPLNPSVTQETIEQTICVHGWTKTVRPPVSYTASIKHKMMSSKGMPLEDEDGLKLDHKIPLALGGSPEAIDNLML